MSNQINDGQVAFGSREIYIGPKGVYETDDFKFDTPTKETTKTNAQDKVTGRVIVKQGTMGSATFQYLAGQVNGATIPAFGDQFTTPEGIWSICDVGDEEKKDGEAKIPVKFKLNVTNNIAIS